MKVQVTPNNFDSWADTIEEARDWYREFLSDGLPFNKRLAKDLAKVWADGRGLPVQDELVELWYEHLKKHFLTDHGSLLHNFGEKIVEEYFRQVALPRAKSVWYTNYAFLGAFLKRFEVICAKIMPVLDKRREKLMEDRRGFWAGYAKSMEQARKYLPETDLSTPEGWNERQSLSEYFALLCSEDELSCRAPHMLDRHTINDRHFVDWANKLELGDRLTMLQELEKEERLASQ